MIRTVRGVFMLLASLAIAGCAAKPEDRIPTRQDVLALEQAILALGEGIDPAEAARAAQISYDYTRQLAAEYQITDPPLVHNSKVNMGIKPRGLCWHWAEDMENRLYAEGFQTLDMHRAIANADNPFRISHSTAIVSRKGDGMFDGIVVDPWRLGGVLTWVKTVEDDKYNWRPQAEVHQLLRKRQIAKARRGAAN